MRRYRKILVAVDASESSKNALRQACKVARKNNGWVTVITVVPPYEDQGGRGEDLGGGPQDRG
jgi:nucleotide-binding universal stress UspA family protein